MEKIECPDCEGDGFILDHEEHCDGECNETDCPQQFGCENCNGQGFVLELGYISEN